MKCGSVILILSGALSIMACGAEGNRNAEEASITDASKFEGIYQLTAVNENTAGCATVGASMLAQLRDQFFVISSSQIFDQKLVVLNSCNSVADCQAKRAAQLIHQAYQTEYNYKLSSSANATTLHGFEAGIGTDQGTQCIGRTYANHVLTVAADHSVHLESRIKQLADEPPVDGFCEAEPAKAKQEAASRACSTLEVLDGSFLQEE